MTQTIELPIWLFVLILLFAVVTFASHFLFPSVRWFFRRRLEKVIGQLNERLTRPIEPFKLARRYDMIQRIIYDPQVAQAVSDHARAEGIPENVAFEEAKRYAREIVPSFSASMYFGFAIRLARFMSNELFRVQVEQYDQEGLQAIDPEATVVFVMNHRSNMDYVLVTYLAAENAALSYAVGEWARVWPLSKLIRSMGAYFIRRRSRNELYRRVLSCYVRQATAAGVTQAMFPEGGLSQTGALQPPRMGLLKYITAEFNPEGRDVVFVPVALNYDQVLEDRILIGAAKHPKGRFKARISVIAVRAVKQFLLKCVGRYHKFGHAAVSFGHPLSLRAYHQAHNGEPAEALAEDLMARIGDIVPVLPVPLIAHLLKENGAIDRAGLELGVAMVLRDLPTAHLHLEKENAALAVDHALRELTRRKLVAVDGDRIIPSKDSDELFAFYANSIRHLLPGPVHSSETPTVENAADARS